MHTTHRLADRSQAAAALQHVFRYFEFFDEHAHAPDIADFAYGNPQDGPLPAYVEALQRATVPHDKGWFAYKLSEPNSRETVSRSLSAWRGIDFAAEDILMTTGAFAGLFAALWTLVEAGDEVIFNSPPWFFYEAQILAVGGRPVRVRVDPATFDLDLDAIAGAITDRTRAIIVNSPNNPTGRIYPPETLQALADLLADASARHGHPIYLLSDEAYSRIIYDGRAYPSPTAYYPYTLLIYTYGKTLLSPGQRIGFIALPPAMPEREPLRDALMGALLLIGFAFPNALLQHALPDLDRLSIDIGQLQARRDWLVGALREQGYELHSPEGAFYLLPRAPIADDWEFVRILARHNILCLPGTVVEMPGYFRISLTGSDAMIRRALPGFERALDEARRQA